MPATRLPRNDPSDHTSGTFDVLLPGLSTLDEKDSKLRELLIVGGRTINGGHHATIEP